MAKLLHVAILTILILAIVGIIAYPYLKSLSKPHLEVSLDKNPVEPGFVNILVKSNAPIKDMTVKIGDRRASFISSEDNTYHYRYFVSPYIERDPVNLTEIKVEATDKDGNYLSATTHLNVSYFAIGDIFGGVIYYYPANPPTKENPQIDYTPPQNIVLDILSKRNVSFFFEVDEGKSKRNAEIINAFQPLVTNLTARGVNLTSYAVEVRNENWVNCIGPDTKAIQVSDCKYKAYNTPSIVLKLPVYPTTQVLLTNTTIEMQPAVGNTNGVVNSLLVLLTPRWIIQTNSSAQ